MTDDLIRYDVLAQEALRGVMRKVLGEVEKTGLPGEHHFFITFLTNAPGVRISSRLREKYPEQMTIVVQHQYWDLKVSDNGFEIGLSFSDVPERLLVPFAAIKGFYDPSVNFELEFDVDFAAGMQDNEADLTALKAPALSLASGGKPKAGGSDSAEVEADETDDNATADVVSLDAFRKKT